MKKGFTLIEMVVVMAVLSLVGLVVLTIFGRTIQGSGKAQIVEIMKQNGSGALDQMDKTIRNAEGVACPGKTATCSLPGAACKNLIIRKEDGVYVRYRFVDPVSSTSNGSIKQDNPGKATLAGSSPPREETDAEFINRACDVSDPLSSSAITLTDTNIESGVSVENATFSRNILAGFSDEVTIQFDLKAGVASAQVNQTPAQNFKTTIKLR